MKICLNCGKVIGIKAKKYCSNNCQQKYQYQDYIMKWKAGKVNGLRGSYQLSSNIIKYLFKKYNNRCALCGWSEKNKYSNKIPLEVEHIDGNYLNNKEDNLILICPNCHSLTATYKALNKGKGRAERKNIHFMAIPS